MMRTYVVLFFLIFSSSSYCDEVTVPRFVCVRTQNAEVRVGPHKRYPIEWIVVRKNLPLEVIREFNPWRKVRDSEGTVLGWIHKNRVSGKRTVLIKTNQVKLHSSPDESSRVKALIEEGVVAQWSGCKEKTNWCRVKIDDKEGWVDRRALWGIYPHEMKA